MLRITCQIKSGKWIEIEIVSLRRKNNTVHKNVNKDK